MEPWLTNSITGVHPLQAALLYSFQHARQDLRKWTEGLTTEQLWRRSGEAASVGFHVLHIAGSIDRLLTYARGEQLTEGQMQDLRAEQEKQDVSLDELLQVLEASLLVAEETLRNLVMTDLDSIREIGRKKTRVPLGVLLVHIAEHTQRHVGAAIVTTKLVR